MADSGKEEVASNFHWRLQALMLTETMKSGVDCNQELEGQVYAHN
jgi:hypothetical protein